MKQPKIPVALEGVPFIALAGLASLITALIGWKAIAVISFLLTCFICYFFRDPERVCPLGEDTLVSPADGRILRVENIFDKRFVGEDVCKISIFMNVFNVHVNRIPFAGKVIDIKYFPGKFYNASTDQGDNENESCAVFLEIGSGRKLVAVQIAGLIARRIVCWAEQGDSVRKGQRFGLIRFGSRVDLYLPPQSMVSVKAGQKVKAGETILGTLPSS